MNDPNSPGAGEGFPADRATLAPAGLVAPPSAPAQNADLDDRRQCERLRHALRQMGGRLARARAELAQARSSADHDALTGLPNRRALDGLASRVRSGAVAGEGMVAVLFIDLDGFKPVNDRMGHAAGDEVLRVVASRLMGATRRNDFVCRMGGDEFVCVLLDMRDESCARAIARELIELIAAPFDIHGAHVRLAASVGVAMHRLQGADVAQLAHEADQAMYAAKSRGLAMLTD